MNLEAKMHPSSAHSKLRQVLRLEYTFTCLIHKILAENSRAILYNNITRIEDFSSITLG